MSNNENNKYTHIIGCRYNHDLYTNNVYEIKNRDEWMKDRILKFKKLLLSLESQTNKNFTFLIFIDANTPKNLKDELTQFIPTVLKTVKWVLIEKQFNVYLQNLKISTEYLITSRIDNDDEYLPNFVKSVQDSFNECEEVIDVNGIQYDTINDKKYTSGRITPNSPFISLIEKSDNIRSVYKCSHTNMCKQFKCRFSNNNEYNYIQNIHENNLMNKIIGNLI